jgi:hypothetical protein
VEIYRRTRKKYCDEHDAIAILVALHDRDGFRRHPYLPYGSFRGDYWRSGSLDPLSAGFG